MKLHLPARLRSALLACLAVVAPLTGTVATGTFFGGAVVASLSLTEAQAAEVVVGVGMTEVYDASNSYVLNGGTLKVESGAVSSSVTIGAADSAISLADGTVLSPLRVTLAEGVTSYKLIGSGTFDLASATEMYGANASSADWVGTVSIANKTGVGNFNINNYGNANSSVKLSGVAGWLALGAAFNPTLILENAADASAFCQTDGSSGREYAFTAVRGSGDFERGGTKFTGAVSYAFSGNIADWTGNFLNNYGQTTLIFRGSASEINLQSITHNAGYDMGLNFNGSGSTVVNSLIQTTGGGAINMTIANSADVTFNRDATVNTLSVGGGMTVGATSHVQVGGAATVSGKLNVNGTLSLENGVTLSNSIVNKGNLTISGAMVVESSNLQQSTSGDSTFSDGANGIQTGGFVEYTVIENSVGAKLNVSGVSLSFDGDVSLTLSSSGKVAREADTSSTRYWVNSGDVSCKETGAVSYFMNGGTLVMDKTDAAAQGAALVSVEGGKGTVRIVADTTLTGQQVTKAACDLIVSGAVLKLGTGEAQATNVSGFSSVTLEENAALFIESQSSVINNLTVNETGGRFDVKDTQGVPSSNPYKFVGVTTLRGTLTRTSNGGWGNGVMFDRLTGDGELVYTNNPNEQSYIAINSLQGFTGDLSFTQTNNNSGAYEVVINSGAAAVSMNSISVGCIDKAENFRNMSVSLDATSGLKLQQLTIRSNTDLNVTGASGLDVGNGVVVMGVDNRISVIGESALNLRSLSVQDGGVLSLVGQYSALAMNHLGSVNLSEMSLTDGASLVYGADAATLRLGSENLLGGVKVDLNSLTDSQSLAIAQKVGLDLGIDSSVDKSLISVVADNIRDAKLDNSGDTWKITSGIVSMYWEAGSDNWNGSDANWAFNDEGTPVSAYVKGSDAIFSGDAGAVVTINAKVDVQNVEVRNGSYTFRNETGADFVIGNDLLLSASAQTAFEASSGNLNVAGDVEVGKGAVLSASVDAVRIAGALSGEGRVNVKSDLALGASSSIGQLVVDGNVEMTGSTKNLTVGGASSAAALSKVDKLTVSKGGSMKVASATVLQTLAGEGALQVTDLTLKSGASAIGSLTADSVSLKKNATISVGSLNASTVNMVYGSVVESGTPIVAVDKIAGDTAFNLSVQKTGDLKKLTNGEQITIVTWGQASGAVTGDLIAPPAGEGEIVQEMADAEGFSVTSNLRGFGYTLVTDSDSKSIVLNVGRDSKGWMGAESDTWTQGSGAGWQAGFVPNPDDRAAGFFGYGSSVVNVDAAGVNTALVDVDIARNLLETKPSYTFVGGEVNSKNMMIGQGELIIGNVTNIAENVEVYSYGKLSVAVGGRLNVDGNLDLTESVSLSLAAGSSMHVSGTLSAEKDVTITNDGVLSVETIAVSGLLTNNELSVSAGGSVGRVEGGKLSLLKDSAVLKVGSMNVQELQMQGSGATVELTEDSTIGLLCGLSSAADQTIISSASLALDRAATGAVNVTAKSLTLSSIENVFGTISVPVLTVDLKDTSLDAAAAVLSVDSLVAVEPVEIILTQSTIEALPVGADSLIVASDYKIVSGISGHDVGDFTIADSIMQEIKRRGVTAELKVQGEDLVLSLGEIEGGMIWDTAEGQVTNNGYVIPDGKGLYSALDYVEQVLVSKNKTLDLTAEGVGNAADSATNPAVGLIVRNPDGGAKLTLKGDAAGEDGVLPDVATIISNREIATPVELVADSLKVNLGLPEGVTGVLAGDAVSDTMVLASVELKDNAQLQVNADTQVKRATALIVSSALTVAEGKSLSTGQLNGDETATVSGKVNILGVGGAYVGSYGADGAELELHKGAFQSVKAGKGLSLLVSGGEGTLDLAGADAEMTALCLGSKEKASGESRSELVISNVTLDDENRKVEHHALKLNSAGSYIANAELTASLGAEETAVTLGSDKAPVIIDGKVDVSNSSICLTMVTTNDDLRSLDVNTDAPMVGAKLATLTVDGSIGAGNEVELIGSRAMMNVINKYYTNARLDGNGDVLVDRVTDYYSSKSDGMSETGTIGVEMLDKVLVHLNPQANIQEYSDLAGVLNALDDAVVAGDTAGADKLVSAVTGVSAAAMGAALAGDMERQLRAIRNRTTTMGVDQGTVNHNMPYFNAWINAEYDNRRLDADGTLAGYEYSVTGGTFGFDVDVSPRFVCGMAVSALTGDISSEGPDALEADVDSYYLTAFARATHRRWTHTFVASVGKSDLSIDRTVSFPGGSYSTKGETEAISFGAMYELGYVFALDVDGTTCLQPVFNVSVAHSSMDGYTESGSDAALELGNVDMTAVTVGLGARLQSVVGQNLFNRASIFEARALVKVNAGDRDAEVDASMVALPTASGKVRSAERGPVSLELGAGITVPIGSKSGSLFVDGSAELGAEYTGLNATVGYRLNF